MVLSDREPLSSVFAPADADAQLHSKISALRSAGERVVQALPGDLCDAQAMGCDRQLIKQDGSWVLTAV